jgi:hypothetical protein
MFTLYWVSLTNNIGLDTNMVKYLSPFEITQTVIEKQDSVPVEDPEMNHEMSSAAGRFRKGDFSLISACEHLV